MLQALCKGPGSPSSSSSCQVKQRFHGVINLGKKETAAGVGMSALGSP